MLLNISIKKNAIPFFTRMTFYYYSFINQLLKLRDIRETARFAIF